MEICISIIPEFSSARREGSLQTLSRAASLSGWLSSTIPFGQNLGAWAEPSGEKAWGRGVWTVRLWSWLNINES